MKVKRILYYVLMFLPLLTTVIAIPFLPEQIPAHYDAAGMVTRWGSKYETIIFPVFIIVFGLFILAMAKIAAKQEKNGNYNEKVTIVIGIVSLVIFNALAGYFLYMDFYMVQDLSTVSVDITQLMFGILAVAMLIIGNLMPKVKMNSNIGFRTKWSMKNEVTWKKCQHFAGISFMMLGVILLMISFLAKKTLCMGLSMAAIWVIILIDIFYSYYTAKKN